MLCYFVGFICRHLTSGYGSNRTTPVGSRNQSREPSRNRDSSRNRDAPAADGETEKRMTAVAAPTEHATEYIEKKTKSLVDEYLQIHDLKVRLPCSETLALIYCVFFGCVLVTFLLANKISIM